MMLLKKYVSLNEAISYLESECGFKIDRPFQEQVKDIVQIANDNGMKLYVHYRGEVELIKNYTRGNLTQFTDECCTVYLHAIYETLYGCPIGESISKIELGEVEVTLWIYYKVHEWITLPRKYSKYVPYDYSGIDHSKETIIRFKMNDENEPTFSDIRILSDDLIDLVKNINFKNSDLYAKNEQLQNELKNAHERIKILENQQASKPNDTPVIKKNDDTSEYQHNQRKPIKHLLYALVKKRGLTLTQGGQGTTHTILFDMCNDCGVPVTEGFLKSRLKELYELEQELPSNSKNKVK